MVASSRARKQSTFLKAFARVRTISAAAKAVRVSREQVHRWIKSDPTFARQFNHIKRQQIDEHFQSLETALQFFCQVVRPVTPLELWPRVTAELGLALANLKRDLKGATFASSGNTTRSFVLHDGGGNVAVLDRSSDDLVDNL